MGAEIQFDYASASTLYACTRNLAGLVWYVSGQVFETWGTSSRTAANYAISLTSDNGDQHVGDFDINIAAGRYYLQSFIQAGGGPVDGDTFNERKFIIWEGTAQTFPATPKEVWDRIISKANHDISQSAGKVLRTLDVAVTSGTSRGSGNGKNQIQLATSEPSVDGTFDPSLIYIAEGTGVGQARYILEYRGSDRMATVDRDWKIQPSTDSEYVILATAGREHVNEGLAQGGTANTITLNALASDEDDIYRNQYVFIRSGTGQDQVERVIAYNGTTKIATMSRNWRIIPNTTTGYVMLPMGCVETQAVGSTELDAKVGSNFDVFFQNSGNDTTRIIDNVLHAGAGAITWTYTLTSTVSPFPTIPDADIWVTSDSDGLFVLASGTTDANGQITFYLDAGTVYVWRQKSGWNFVNPDTEVVA